MIEKHSKESIFVCPRRTFIIGKDGKIPDQPTPVDYRTKEGKCSFCGTELEDSRIEDYVYEILKLIGEDPDRLGLKDTPSRIAKMYKEIFKGYNLSLKPELTVFENGADGITYDELLFDTGSFVSWCEHHMLAFRGRFYIGYIPDKKISGLSKFARIVDYYS